MVNVELLEFNVLPLLQLKLFLALGTGRSGLMEFIALLEIDIELVVELIKLLVLICFDIVFEIEIEQLSVLL